LRGTLKSTLTSTFLFFRSTSRTVFFAMAMLLRRCRRLFRRCANFHGKKSREV
jgi:hypothetical protein